MVVVKVKRCFALEGFGRKIFIMANHLHACAGLAKRGHETTDRIFLIDFGLLAISPTPSRGSKKMDS